MFFCKRCGERNGWPESLFKSEGPCECCGTTAICSDVASKHLPIPGKTMEETKQLDADMENRLRRVMKRRASRMKTRKGHNGDHNPAA